MNFDPYYSNQMKTYVWCRVEVILKRSLSVIMDVIYGTIDNV